jgi:ribonuclease P protein component
VKHTFGKEEHLKSRKLIEHLFRDGKSFALTPFRVYYQLPAAEQKISIPAQMGVGVSAKNFKKAVDRNRIKRLIREAYRLQKTELHLLLKERKKRLNVFIIYTGKKLPEYKEIFDKMNSALAKMGMIVPAEK